MWQRLLVVHLSQRKQNHIQDTLEKVLEHFFKGERTPNRKILRVSSSLVLFAGFLRDTSIQHLQNDKLLDKNERVTQNSRVKSRPNDFSTPYSTTSHDRAAFPRRPSKYRGLPKRRISQRRRKEIGTTEFTPHAM